MCNDFIGKTFGKNNQVEVVAKGVGRDEYVVKCSECAKDYELFGEGLFKTSKVALLKGQLPCACTKISRWSEEQQIVRINRVCRKNNMTFLEFVGPYKGSDTKVKLQCNVDGNVWVNSINKITYAEQGCPHCSGGGSLKPDSVMIDRFLKSEVFLEGTAFWRSDRRNSRGDKSFWKYTCPMCSNDEYVHAGLCSGEFEGTSNDLQVGHLSCRCSPSYRWTKEQREYQIQKIIREEQLPYTYLGFIGDWKASKTRLEFCCAEHGKFTTRLNSFINLGIRCAGCAATGYDPTKVGFLYVISVVGAGVDFTGYGISNYIRERLMTHRRSLGHVGCTITDYRVFTGDGRIVLDTENFIKYNFDVFRQEVKGFKKEATHSCNFNEVVIAAKNNLKECHDVVL